MKNKLQNLVYKVRSVVLLEDGQDLIEYALVVALIAFAAVAGMTTVAGAINTAFTNIGLQIVSYT